MTPKNTKSTINYEKILDKYEHPIELNSLANSNKQIIATINANKKIVKKIIILNIRI